MYRLKTLITHKVKFFFRYITYLHQKSLYSFNTTVTSKKKHLLIILRTAIFRFPRIYMLQLEILLIVKGNPC